MSVVEKNQTAHIKSQLASTTRVLELFYMDLMRPMQLESIDGKRCIYAEAIKTTCYILNRTTLRLGTIMTPYMFWKYKNSNLELCS